MNTAAKEKWDFSLVGESCLLEITDLTINHKNKTQS